jgi:hypothetical protein
MSIGAKVGIGVTVGLAILTVIVGSVCLRMRRRKRSSSTLKSEHLKAELADTSVLTKSIDSPVFALDGKEIKELEAIQRLEVVEICDAERVELGTMDRVELPTPYNEIPELHGESAVSSPADVSEKEKPKDQKDHNA